jgi:hypothetical protein
LSMTGVLSVPAEEVLFFQHGGFF